MFDKKKRKRVLDVNMLKEWVSPVVNTSYFVGSEAEEFEEDGIVLLHEEKDQDNGGNLCTGRHLDDGQLRELQNLLNQYSDVMQTKPGRTHLAEHNIETGAARPVKQPPYCLPHAYQDEVLKELAEMEKEGVIEPSMSEWASPMVLVKKKDGSLKMCVDYRRLNSVSRADAYPMPRIDELIDWLGKAKYISKRNLSRGYWQVPVEAASRDKTAFVTPQGLFQFRVMPFGLHGAPATFKRLMD